MNANVYFANACVWTNEFIWEKFVASRKWNIEWFDSKTWDIRVPLAS